MKRFHVHLHVDNLQANIDFYAAMFGAEPARVQADYAKWMLSDPPVNFAISTRGAGAGIDHLGIQTEDAAELAEMKQRAQAADMALLDEGETTCCYARSEKHWITDPQGIAWEAFHTLDDIPVFSQRTADTKIDDGASEATCCAGGAPRGAPAGVAVDAKSACCRGTA